MKHDPICLDGLEDWQITAVSLMNPADCDYCKMIAKARFDERQRIIGVMERNADGNAFQVIDAVLDML